MGRLGKYSLAVLALIVVPSFALQWYSSLDDVDVTDEVVQVLRQNEEQGREVAVLDLATATRWSDGGGPTRRVAEERQGEANSELDVPFDKVDESDRDVLRYDCLYWPVVRAGRPIEDVESLYRVCYDSSRPGARPMSGSYMSVHQP